MGRDLASRCWAVMCDWRRWSIDWSEKHSMGWLHTFGSKENVRFRQMSGVVAWRRTGERWYVSRRSGTGRERIRGEEGEEKNGIRERWEVGGCLVLFKLSVHGSKIFSRVTEGSFREGPSCYICNRIRIRQSTILLFCTQLLGLIQQVNLYTIFYLI